MINVATTDPFYILSGEVGARGTGIGEPNQTEGFQLRFLGHQGAEEGLCFVRAGGPHKRLGLHPSRSKSFLVTSFQQVPDMRLKCIDNPELSNLCQKIFEPIGLLVRESLEVAG